MNKYIKLGDVATFMNGYAFKPADWEEQGLPIIRIQNLTSDNKNFNYYNKNYDTKYEINKGDVLISWSASLGVYEWQGEKALLNQHIFKVVFDKIEVDKRFFIYAVKILLKNIENNLHGSTMKHITKPMFENLKFPVLSIEKQRKIADVLDCVSNILNMKKSQFNNINELSKFQFLKMFDLPNSNRYNFKLGIIRDCVAKIQYGTSKPSTSEGKYKYLRMNNITYDGYLDISDIKTIDVNNSEFEKFSVKYGDVLFNRTNSPELVGKTCVFNLNTPMIIAGYIIKIRVNNKILPVYLSTMLNTSYGKKLLYNISKKSIGQANINSQELQNIKILIPPIELQNKFADFVRQTEKCLFELQKSIDETQLLFDSLMDKYFS